MFTSCFSRLKHLPAGLEPVAISRGVPGWFKGRQYLDLAPTRAMLALPLPEFNRQYEELLSKLDPQKVLADLGDTAVLLCWEAPNECCHRRQVAEHLEKHLGIVITEAGFERSQILPYAQMPLKSARKQPACPRLTARRAGNTNLF